MSKRPSNKNPDDRYLGNIWSISSHGTLYVGTLPGQQLPRGATLTQPTRLGVVVEVRYTSKCRTSTGGKVPAFKILVHPAQPTPTPTSSPVYVQDKWWVVAEGNFDPFEHVPRWQTPQELLAAYELFTQSPKGRDSKEGRWLKNYFAADVPLDNSFSESARAQVRTTTPATRRRLEQTGNSPSASSTPSGGFNVFGNAPTSQPPANAMEAMMSSQSSQGSALPPPPQGRIGMMC